MEQIIKDGLTLEAALEKYEPMVHRFVNAASTNYVCNKEDLEQEGRMAIIKAFGTYDPEQGVSFTTWVYPYIRGAVLDYQKANLSCLSGGNYLQQLMKKMGPDVTMEDLKEMKLTKNTINAMNYINDSFSTAEIGSLEIGSYDPISLDFTFEMIDWRKYLTHDEVDMIEKYFGFNDEPMTMAAIGEEVGISRNAISKRLQKALKKLRDVPGLEDYLYD